MSSNRTWSAYPITYRAKEMKQLARWIQMNTSGSVVGFAGSGKSNLLRFLCHRPDALQEYLPQLNQQVAIIPVDLNSLPANNLATLYRFILRSLFEVRAGFDTQLQSKISGLYRENRATRDPFLPQSALRELFHLFQADQMRIVLVLDRFDKFCQQASVQMSDSLRGLRDSFKETLSFIAGMRQEVVYLSDPSVLGELYELLDTHVCRVGAMNEDDARNLMRVETRLAAEAPSETVTSGLMAMTGRYPSLLKAACHWWIAMPDVPFEEWTEALLAERSVSYRLKEIWDGLSQEEQKLVSELQRWTVQEDGQADKKRAKQPEGNEAIQELLALHQSTLARLAAKGIVDETESGWRLSSELFGSYVVVAGGRSRGRLWYDERANLNYQDQTPLQNLAPLEHSLLRFLLSHPHIRHTYTELIEAAWPEDVNREGVSTEALYQVIRGLRRQIEPVPSRPRYVVNWRGKPEGGYQCFPEGRPE